MDEFDLRNMRDDSDKVRCRLVPCYIAPSWHGESSANDPLKAPYARRNCPNCGRYCLVDYFHKDFLMDCASGNVKKAGNGHLLRGDNLNFENMMRCCRNGALHFFESYLKRILPKEEHGYINECIHQKVKDTYPDPNRNYKGYQYTVEHMKALMEMEDAEEQESWSDLEKEDEDEEGASGFAYADIGHDAA